MLEELKKAVCEANLRLVEEGLVYRTFGNVSGIDERRRHVVIKPSGVPYDRMRPRDMVVVALADGRIVEGGQRPSSDTPTHLALYRAWPSVGGVAHTHSLHATAWAQTRKAVPAYGTTHADYFHGAIPCTRVLRAAEINGLYEAATGDVIVETFARRRLSPAELPGVLVAAHGPFAWGPSAAAAVEAAAILEHLVRLAAMTVACSPDARPVPQALLDKHYRRKHGPNAYYGQKGA
jgi:L-ribulose-5-phosphate 4-epimerase